MQKLIAFLLGRTSTASILGDFEKILTNLRAHQARKEAETVTHEVKLAKVAKLRDAAVGEFYAAERAAAGIETMLGLRAAAVVDTATKAVDATEAVAVKVQVDAAEAIDTLNEVSKAAGTAQAGISALAGTVKVVAGLAQGLAAPTVVVSTPAGPTGSLGPVGAASAVIAGSIVGGLQDAAACCDTGLVDGVCVTPGQPCGATGATGAPVVTISVTGPGTDELIANGGTIAVAGATGA